MKKKSKVGPILLAIFLAITVVHRFLINYTKILSGFPESTGQKASA